MALERLSPELLASARTYKATPSPVTEDEDKPSRLGVVGRGAIRSAVPTIAGGLAGIAAAPPAIAATAPMGGLPGMAASLAVGTGTAIATAKAQQKLFEAFPDVAEALGQSPEQIAADYAAYPKTAIASELLPGLLYGRPSLQAASRTAGKSPAQVNAIRAARMQVPIGAGIAGGTDIGMQKFLEGREDIDWTRAGIVTAGGALLSSPTALTRNIENRVVGALPVPLAERYNRAINRPVVSTDTSRPPANPISRPARGENYDLFPAELAAAPPAPPPAPPRRRASDRVADVSRSVSPATRLGEQERLALTNELESLRAANDTENPALASALAAVTEQSPTAKSLAEASLFGRDNNRPDILAAAADRAEARLTELVTLRGTMTGRNRRRTAEEMRLAQTDPVAAEAARKKALKSLDDQISALRPLIDSAPPRPVTPLGGQRDIFVDQPSLTISPDYSPPKVLALLRSLLMGANDRRVATDGRLLQVANQLSKHFTNEGKPGAAGKYVASRQADVTKRLGEAREDLDNGLINQQEYDARVRSLQDVGKLYQAAARVAETHARRVAEARDVETRVATDRAEQSQDLAVRARLLDEVLADPTTVDPAERFRAVLRAAGRRDVTVRPLERSRIEQAAAARTTSSVPPMGDQPAAAPIPAPAPIVDTPAPAAPKPRRTRSKAAPTTPPVAAVDTTAPAAPAPAKPTRKSRTKAAPAPVEATDALRKSWQDTVDAMRDQGAIKPQLYRTLSAMIAAGDLAPVQTTVADIARRASTRAGRAPRAKTSKSAPAKKAADEPDSVVAAPKTTGEDTATPKTTGEDTATPKKGNEIEEAVRNIERRKREIAEEQKRKEKAADTEDTPAEPVRKSVLRDLRAAAVRGDDPKAAISRVLNKYSPPRNEQIDGSQVDDGSGVDLNAPAREDREILSRPGINQKRTAKMLGAQLYGDVTEIARVSLKEVLQNSFDAVRSAMRTLGVSGGKIDIRTTDNSISMLDNGVGMAPEFLANEFLEIAGTGKDATEASGGFGIAKMLFLYGNNSLRVITMRDGVVAELNTSGQQLFDALSEPGNAPKIKVRSPTEQDKASFPNGHGTLIRIEYPTEVKVVGGDTKAVKRVRYMDDSDSLVLSPLFRDIEVTFNGDPVSIGRNFPVDKFTQFANIKFPWGKARVYVSKAPKEYVWRPNLHILSNGLHQFSESARMGSGLGARSIPHDFYVDIQPNVRPDELGYPFEFNRQSLTKQAAPDIAKVLNYIKAMYAYDNLAASIEDFGEISYIDPETGAISPPVKVEPTLPPPSSAFKGFKPTDKVTVEDGRLLVNGKELPELTPSELSAGVPSADKLMVDPSMISPDKVMIHDNAAVTLEDGSRQPITDYMRAVFGAKRFDEFQSVVGETFFELRNMVSKTLGYKDLLKEGIGLSYDIEYRGVSIRVPFSGSFINPLLAEGRTPTEAAFGLMGTMVHELAHHRVRPHDEQFPAEMQRIQYKLYANTDFAQLQSGFAEVVASRYPDILTQGQKLFEDSRNGVGPIRVEPRGKRFTDSAETAVPDRSGERVSERPAVGARESGGTEQMVGPAAEGRRSVGSGRLSEGASGSPPRRDGEVGDPLLSRPNRREPPRGMAVDEVSDVVSRLTSDWKNAPEIEVVASVDDIPGGAAIPKDADAMFMRNGKIYVVADNATGASHIKASVYHESLGHFGLRTKFGKQLSGILNDLYRTNTSLRNAADQWIASQLSSAEGERYYGGLSQPELRMLAAEEVLAGRSEAGPQQLKGLSGAFARLKSAIRSFGRKMGLDISYSDADVRQILAQAHREVMSGRSSGRSARLRESFGLPSRAEPTVGRLSRPSGPIVGNNARTRTQALNDPRNLEATAADWWTNTTGVARRGLLKMMGQRWITEKYRDKIPQLEKWLDLLVTKSTTADSYVQKAAQIHDAWRKLHPEEIEEVGTLLIDASRQNTNVRNGQGALQSRYDALSKDAQDVYDAVRKSYDDQFDRAKAILTKFINDDTQMSPEDRAEALKELDTKFKRREGYFPFERFGDWVVVARSEDLVDLQSRADELSDNMGNLSDAQRTVAAEELADIRKQIAELQADGDSYIVTAHESEAEMRNVAQQLRDEGFDVREKLAADFNPATDAVSATFMRRINDSLNNMVNMDPDSAAGVLGLKSMLNQMYLTMMPEGSPLKRQLQRRSIAGQSEDAQRVFAATARRNANYLSELENGYQTRNLLEEMRDAVRDQPIEVQEVYQQLRQHYNQLQQHVRTPIQDALASATYAYMLGSNPSFTVLQLMQTPMIAAPLLAGRNSVPAVTRALVTAGKDVVSIFKDIMESGTEFKAGRNAGEQNMLRYMMSRNALAGTEASDFMAVADGAKGLSKAGQVAMKVAGFLPHHAERLNRISTALAAYRLALGNPKILAEVSNDLYNQYRADHPDVNLTKAQYAAARYAEKMVTDAHVDFAQDTLPYLMQRGVIPGSRLMLQFKKYQYGMMKIIVQNASDVIRKEVPANERWAAARTLASTLATHQFMTGLMGLPFFGAGLLIADLYRRFAGDPDDPIDAETRYRNWVTDTFGREAGEVISRGILRAPGIRDVAPADITGRVGLGELLVGGDRLGQISGENLQLYLASVVGGPALSMLGNMVDGTKMLANEEYQRAAEAFLPKVFRDLFKAQRFATEGVITSKGKLVIPPEDLSTADIAAQALGFQPQRLESAYAARNAFTKAELALQTRKNKLLKQYTRAVRVGDDAAKAEVRQNILAYNRKQIELGNYSAVLSPASLQRALREQAKDRMLLRNGVSPRPRERGIYENYADFAEEEE